MASARASLVAQNFEDAARGFLKASEAYKGAQPAAAGFDGDGVRRALAAYKQAYESMDERQLLEVFPTAGELRLKEIQRSKKACKSLEVNFGAVTIDPVGEEVLVQAQSTYDCTPKAGRHQPLAAVSESFFFKKGADGRWRLNRTASEDTR